MATERSFASEDVIGGRMTAVHLAVNADGGAIAPGHRLGCSGAHITITLANRLHREGGNRGLAALGVGVGQGVALIERV